MDTMTLDSDCGNITPKRLLLPFHRTCGGRTPWTSAGNMPASVSGRDRPAAPRVASSWMHVGSLALELLTSPCTAYRGGAPHLAHLQRISHIRGWIGPTVASERDHAGGRGAQSHARESAPAAIGRCSPFLAAAAAVPLLLPRSKRSPTTWNPAPPSSRAPTPPRFPTSSLLPGVRRPVLRGGPSIWT
jgi:hypothetical protein